MYFKIRCQIFDWQAKYFINNFAILKGTLIGRNFFFFFKGQLSVDQVQIEMKACKNIYYTCKTCFFVTFNVQKRGWKVGWVFVKSDSDLVNLINFHSNWVCFCYQKKKTLLFIFSHLVT